MFLNTLPMDSNYMRSLLKRICKNATAYAKSMGYDIDFEKKLFIYFAFNTWIVSVADGRVHGVFRSDSNKSLKLGAEFMRHVPAIDRFEGIQETRLMESPVGKNYLDNHSCNVMIPVVDEFAYQFSGKALEMMLHAMMSKGSFAKVEKPDVDIARRALMDENASFHHKLWSLRKTYEPLSNTTSRASLMKEYSRLVQEHGAKSESIMSILEPVKVPLVPHPCSTFEELEIVLDMEMAS